MKCHLCEPHYEIKNNYNDCPVSCENTNCFNYRICPKCGGDYGPTKNGNADLDNWTAGECQTCGHQCCGGCV